MADAQLAPRLARALGPNRRRIWIAAAVLLGLVALGIAGLAGFRLARPGALPNMSLAGRAVGGLDETSLRKAVETLAVERGERRLTVVRPATPASEEVSVSAPAAELGYRLDVDETVQAVLDRGRQGNPFASLADHLAATFGSVEASPVESLDEARFESWASQAVRELNSPPREGSLAFRGTTVTPIPPAAGAAVLAEDLRAQVRASLDGRGPARIVAPTRTVAPRTTPADVDRVLEEARAAVSGPITLTRGERAIALTRMQISEALEVRLVTQETGTGLELEADPAKVQVSQEAIEAVETDPLDASFTLSGGEVRVVPGRKGFRFDVDRLAAQLVAVATSKERTAKLAGREVVPEFTTAEAKALDISERVSTFTTYHSCCEPRVMNIHRIADILDGTVVMPGDVLSVNDAVGMRTVENGFVPAPAIRDGEFVEEVGGGISQFATTMFNAIYFGGYDLLEYKAHSYYFTRYPMGREATVSWPWPDLEFRNDSEAGIFIKTAYDDTSITVSFYGNQPVEIDSVTGAPYNFTDPAMQCEENPSLKDGQSTVVQEGAQGFDVIVKRLFSYPDGREVTEELFTRYKAEPRIVEHRTCAGG
jgi:vancomycin resistance protein YoaR